MKDLFKGLLWRKKLQENPSGYENIDISQNKNSEVKPSIASPARAVEEKESGITSDELKTFLSSMSKISVAHLKLSAELKAAQKAYQNDPSSESKDALLKAVMNKALPAIEKLTSLKKGLELNNQVCPSLNKYISVIKDHFIHGATKSTEVTVFFMKKLNEEAEKIAPNMMAKDVLKDNIVSELKQAGLSRNEILILDQADYEKLKPILTEFSTLNIRMDNSSGEFIYNIPNSRLNEKKSVSNLRN